MILSHLKQTGTLFSLAIAYFWCRVRYFNVDCCCQNGKGQKGKQFHKIPTNYFWGMTKCLSFNAAIVFSKRLSNGPSTVINGNFSSFKCFSKSACIVSRTCRPSRNPSCTNTDPSTSHKMYKTVSVKSVKSSPAPVVSSPVEAVAPGVEGMKRFVATKFAIFARCAA